MSKLSRRIGVSPAFLVSQYGKDFTPEDVCNAIEIIQSWGFSHLQIEIYDFDKIPMWLTDSGVEKVNRVREQANFDISILVCHLLINEFTSIESLYDFSKIDKVKELIDIAKSINTCRYLLLPFGSLIREAPNNKKLENFGDYKKQFFEKFSLIYNLVNESEFNLLIEILPKSIIGRYETLRNEIINKYQNKIGILFDTGHAWADGENIIEIPIEFRKYIFGTHLCDNFGKESLSLAPGKGNINWKKLINNLLLSDYSGYFDIEILCPKEKVQVEYTEAFMYIKSIIKDYYKNPNHN